VGFGSSCLAQRLRPCLLVPPESMSRIHTTYSASKGGSEPGPRPSRLFAAVLCTRTKRSPGSEKNLQPPPRPAPAPPPRGRRSDRAPRCSREPPPSRGRPGRAVGTTCVRHEQTSARGSKCVGRTPQMHKLAARAPPRGVWCPEVPERAQCACWCLGELYKRASLRRTCSTIVEVVDTKCEHGRRRRVLYGRRNRCKECGGA